jgi:uncharacterized metal-binding protein YceD (DUF177 family)
MKDLTVKTSDFADAKYIERKVICPKDTFEGAGAGSDITVSLRAEKTDNVNVYFSGLISGALKLSCSRCLKEFLHEVKIPISFDLDFDGSRKIDITDEIRQMLFVENPAKPLCDSLCKGVNSGAQITETEDYNIIKPSDDADFTKEKWKQSIKSCK